MHDARHQSAFLTSTIPFRTHRQRRPDFLPNDDTLPRTPARVPAHCAAVTPQPPPSHLLEPFQSGRVAVIGAGAAGLQTACLLRAAGYSPQVYEAASHLGGLWRYSPNRDSPIYRSLRSNITKYTMYFSSDPPAADAPTFLHHTAVYRYLLDYVARHNLAPLVQLNTPVRHLCKAPDGIHWHVSTDSAIDTFDAVFVCAGHYSKPRWCNVPGFLEYLPHLTHSAHYKVPDDYVDATVLVIGGGPSGTDISAELSDFAHRVYISHSKPNPVFPDKARPSNVEEVSRVECVNPDGTIQLQGGRKLRVDKVISCTGYRRQLPFIPEGTAGVRIVCDDHNIAGLLKHCVAIDDPTLCLIGLPILTFPFLTFEKQVAFCIAVLSGKVTKEQFDGLVEDERSEKGNSVYTDPNYHLLGPRRWKYMNDIAEITGTSKVPQSIIELSAYAKQLFRADPKSYRDVELELTGKGSGMWRVK